MKPKEKEIMDEIEELANICGLPDVAVKDFDTQTAFIQSKLTSLTEQIKIQTAKKIYDYAFNKDKDGLMHAHAGWKQVEEFIRTKFIKQ